MPPPNNTKDTPIRTDFWTLATNGISYAGGHVGIGTRAPLYALDVPLGTISANKFRMTDGAANGRVLMSNSDGTAYWATLASGGGSGDSPWQTTAANHIYYIPEFNSGNAGNVGIGTDSPIAKLDIEGDLRIKENLSFNGTNNANITFGTTVQVRTLKIVSNWRDGIKTNILGIAITGTGNVGIGKDNPTALLDVNGDIKATEIEVSGAASCVTLQVSGTATTNGFRMINGAANNLVLVSDDDGDASWKNISSISPESLWDDDGDGNVYRGNGEIGIGTSNPQAVIDIADLYEAGHQLIRVGNDAYLTDLENANTLGVYGIQDNTVGAIKLGSGGPKLYGANNCLAIGTTQTPSEYTLAVGGTIGCTRVIVRSENDWPAWPDYVFEQEYVLPNLFEIEAFVKERKHLPDVPSAEMVAEHGIDLVEMSTILLKKIEELTLFAIAQQKLLDKQQGKIDELDKLVNK